jgi:two-component system, response regulator / RNA-binding antiterminator
MTRTHSTPNFEGGRALILHRPHDVVEATARQLRQIGIHPEAAWPDMPSRAFDVLFYDADMGDDTQFPWSPGSAPMPAIALIGSEAPGRLAWAIRQGADAHLLKPIGSGGVYSALVIAFDAFARRAKMTAALEGLQSRMGQRQVIAEATACLMVQSNISADKAYDELRRDAMAQRVTIEEMAERIVARLRTAHVSNRA